MLRLSVVGAAALTCVSMAVTLSLILLSSLLPRRQITYVNAGDAVIYLMDVDRNITLPLIANGYNPTWSPDGQRLAFYAYGDSKRDIYIMDIFARKPHQITHNQANNGDPAWSADGRQIVFASDDDGAFGIFVMPVDCTAAFDECATRITPKNTDWYAAPAWSPDGQFIAFAAVRDTTSSFDTTLGNSNIYIMRPDGSRTRRLTTNLGEDYTPAWSPDSRSLVYAAQNIQHGLMELMIMDVDCEIIGGCQRLLFSDVVDLMPSWSANGREVVFVDAQDGNFEIFVMDSAGEGIQQLTFNHTDEISPRWRP